MRKKVTEKKREKRDKELSKFLSLKLNFDESCGYDRRLRD